MEKQEINAGYAIKERFVVGSVGIALGHSKTAVAPYVTWNYRKEAPKHFFWGHYFNSEREAMQDYENRINEEVQHFEDKTGKAFPIPRLCLSVMPSTGDLINIKRGVHGYYPSDWNKTEGKEHNREIANFANEKLGVNKAQEAAMLHGSMFGWQVPAANPKSYDDNGYATSSMRKVKIVAKQIVEIAYERDIVRRNVFTKVTVPSLDPKERRALTEEEKTLLINTWRGHRMGLGAMIMLYCGLRRGELLALHWDDIDLVNKIISVNKSVTLYHNRPTIKEPKSEAGKRKVPIPNKLCAILSEAPKDNPLVCPSTEGTLMSECAYRRAWNGYLHYLNIQAGGHDRTPAQAKLQVIDNITAHMLRHSYATMLYDAGVDVKSAQKFLGHASLEMTLGVYTHLSRFKQSEAIDSLNAHLDRE